MPTQRACPREGCFKICDRLNYVRVSRGLEDHPGFWCCDECLAELRSQAEHDLSLLITIVPARELS